MFWIFSFFTISVFLMFRSFKDPKLSYFYLSTSLLSVLFTVLISITYFEKTQNFKCINEVKAKEIINVSKNKNNYGFSYTTKFLDNNENIQTIEKIINENDNVCLEKKLTGRTHFFFKKDLF